MKGMLYYKMTIHLLLMVKFYLISPFQPKGKNDEKQCFSVATSEKCQSFQRKCIHGWHTTSYWEKPEVILWQLQQGR